MKMLNTLMIIPLFVIAVVTEQSSSYTKKCVGQFCFTTPGSSELKSFGEAKSWCNEHNSTLAVVNDSDTQMALTEFMQFSNITAMAYINLQLDRRGDSTWFLLNGTSYKGNVGNQNNITYNLFCRLLNDSKADFTVQASNPSVVNKYICYFEGITCQSNATNYFNFNNRCYVKYENEDLTWFKAREKCLEEGGDLAQFQYDSVISSNTWIVPFNRSYLQLSFTYWVGIRWKDWSWKYPDNGNEITYSSWAQDRPKDYNYSCVCVDPDVTPAWSWTDCDCTSERPFVCLEIVPTTTVITTTPTTTTMTSSISTSSVRPTVYTNINDSINLGVQKQLSKPQIIGLAAGIGGGFLILLIVVIIIVVVVIMRRKRSNDSCSESRPAVENDDEGISNQATESNGKDLYSQVQKSPRNQVISPRGKDVYAQVNKHQQNQVNNDVYADVVPTAKQQTNKTESPPEIHYSAPEFVQDPNLPTTNSDYDVACRVPEPDLLLTPRGQIQSIFPIRYSNQHAYDEEAD